MNSSAKKKGISRPNSDGKRDVIIDAALKVMVSEGLYKATTRKIAEAAGVNIATLHYHFNDKEEIFFLAMERLVSSYRHVLASRFTVPQTVYQRIPELINFICQEVRKNPEEQLALQEMTLYLLRHPEAEFLAREKDREFLSLYVVTLQSSIDAKHYSEQQIIVLANQIYTGLIGALNQWLATKDDIQLQASLVHLTKAAQQNAQPQQPDQDRSF
jgi:AcrR family transcriptional regulator